MDLLFYPRINDATSSSGKCSLYCKITVNRLPCVPFSTDIKVYAKHWQPKKKTTNDEFADTVRQEINRIENILRRIKIDLEERQEPITAEIIKYNYQKLKKEQRQTKKPTNKITLESLFRERTQKKMNDGAKESTDKHDYFMAKSFLTFAESQGYRDIKPSSVTLELVEKFCDNFKSSKNYLRQIVNFLSKTLDTAVKRKLIIHNPVKDIELPKGGGSIKKNNEIGLELEEIEILKNAKLLNDKEEKAIDIFLFMCGTSLDFCDYNTLTEKNIEIVGTKKIIRAERQKTDRYDTERVCEHNAIIKPIALEILEKYGNSIENLPRFKYVYVLDSVLQGIARRCGLEKQITTKRARKTFANLSINYEMHTDEQTAYQMGHVDTKQLKKYRRYNDKILSNLIN